MEMQDDVTQIEEEKSDQIKTTVEKISSFFQNWGWLVAACFALAAFLFLFAPIAVAEFAMVDTEATRVDNINLVGYLSGGYSTAWIMILNIVLMGGGIACSCLSKINRRIMVGASLCFVISLVFICLSKSFLESDNAMQVETFEGIEVGWGMPVSIVMMALAVVISIGASYGNREFSIQDIAEDGILVALAFCLSFLKIPMGATGGSINLQMFPLMLLALRRGPFHGFISGGIVYGLITCLTDGYGFATFPFDYLIGFGSIAVMGFFQPLILSENQKTYNIKGLIWILVGGSCVTLVRFIGSNLSSMVVYGYTFEASLAYNAVYILPSGAAATVLVMAIYGPFCAVNRLFPIKKAK